MSARLTRSFLKPSHFNQFRNLISSQTHFTNAKLILQNPLYSKPTHRFSPRTLQLSLFSTNGKSGNFGDDSAMSSTDLWKLSCEIDQDIESVFSEDSGNLDGFHDQNDGEMKTGEEKIGDLSEGIDEKRGNEEVGDIFRGVDEKEVGRAGAVSRGSPKLGVSQWRRRKAGRKMF